MTLQTGGFANGSDDLRFYLLVSNTKHVKPDSCPDVDVMRWMSDCASAVDTDTHGSTPGAQEETSTSEVAMA